MQFFLGKKLIIIIIILKELETLKIETKIIYIHILNWEYIYIGVWVTNINHK